MASSEEQPLLGPKKDQETKNGKSKVFLVYLCGFFISLSFSFTQSPLIYAFRLMTCDQYYKSNPPYAGTGDRCSVREIEASTARSVSLLGMSTTIFGVLNLFLTTALIRSFGVKFALIQQTLWPAARLCCQIVGISIGAKTGILIIQGTQLVTVLGGPAGYMLATNTFASELVESHQRTGAFGTLQGSVMFGTSLGYLLGGQAGDIFGIKSPFQIACGSMLFSMIYAILFLPHIPPTAAAVSGKKVSGLADILAPLKVFAPQVFRLPSGKTTKQYGVLSLGLGVFFGVLATGYIPVLMQMYATSAFQFGSSENGFLMCFNSLIRGLFLSFAFPRIISWGRKKFSGSSTSHLHEGSYSEDIPVAPENFEAVPGLESEQEPTPLPPSKSSEDDVAFDLVFLRWSLVVDGLLTAAAAFSSSGWQIYLAAFLLPLASGSSSAAKGVIMAMTPKSQNADALTAITLTEMIGAISTMSIFGVLFAIFAEMGKPYLTFICNAGIAVLAVFILTFSHFPPAGSTLVTKDTEEEAA